MTDYFERKISVSRFLNNELTQFESEELFEQYNVTYLFVKNDKEYCLGISNILCEVWTDNQYTLYEILD